MKACNQGYHNNNNNNSRSSSASMALSDIISASRGTALAMEMGSDDAVMSCAHMHTHSHTHRNPCMAMCARSSRVSGDLPQREVMSHCMRSYLAANQESANGLCLCESTDGKKNTTYPPKIDLDVQKRSLNRYMLFFVFPYSSYGSSSCSHCCIGIEFQIIFLFIYIKIMSALCLEV